VRQSLAAAGGLGSCAADAVDDLEDRVDDELGLLDLYVVTACWSVLRGTTLLWRVTPSSGAVEPMGSLPLWGRNLQIGPDRRLALRSPEGAVLVVDLSSRALTHVTLTGAAPRAFAVVPAGGKIISLSRRPQGSTVTAHHLGQVTA
jgi:hypothetical protein